jgi:hypothetical protein
VSDDASGSDGPDGSSGHTDDWDVTAEPTSGSTPRVADPVPRSRLVGLMAEPVSRAVPLRRSTVLMLVAFIGFGTLSYLFPPSGSTTGSPATSGGISGTFIPLATPPTTHPATTTTTTSRPGGAEATTTSTTTTTTRPISTTTTSTSAPVGSTTTTAPRGSTTTTTTPPGPTTTTIAAP